MPNFAHFHEICAESRGLTFLRSDAYIYNKVCLLLGVFAALLS